MLFFTILTIVEGVRPLLQVLHDVVALRPQSVLHPAHIFSQVAVHTVKGAKLFVHAVSVLLQRRVQVVVRVMQLIL